MPSQRTFGSWRSRITSAAITRGSLRLSQPRLDSGSLYWLEGRPEEGGRQCIMRDDGDGPIEITPPDAQVRTRVHEYGGGDYTVHRGCVLYSDLCDERVYRLTESGGGSEPVTPAGSRYADLEVSPDGRWLVAVEERPRGDLEPENTLSAFSLVDPGRGRTLVRGFDFVSFPRFDRAGTALALTTWDHPRMPWHGTRLYRMAWNANPESGPLREVAGGETESIFQPAWSPDGQLTFASDRSGWWNLYRERNGRIHALCPREAEFAGPQWVFGLSCYAYIDNDVILATFTDAHGTNLARLHTGSGTLESLNVPYTSIDGLRVEGRRACFIGAGPMCSPVVCLLDLSTGAVEERRSSSRAAADPATISLPENIEFPTRDGQSAHALLYRPRNDAFTAGKGERPPLLVKSHGGPTGAASRALDLRVQYWTSRGFAVADVDYRGSTGYGRSYREMLNGQWGVLDVTDCVDVVAHLAEAGEVDANRAAISGGSAGGYTTLCALTFHDVFRAGASHYGIGDLEALARDTHKFEARYLDSLVGPYPEHRDVYVQRSPIHFTERLSCPVIFFQGLEDRVVPPNQAEAMVSALAARGIRHAYVPFEGEQHGFRRAENIRAALDSELFFYAEIFGFESGLDPMVEIRGSERG